MFYLVCLFSVVRWESVIDLFGMVFAIGWLGLFDSSAELMGLVDLKLYD